MTTLWLGRRLIRGVDARLGGSGTEGFLPRPDRRGAGVGGALEGSARESRELCPRPHPLMITTPRRLVSR